MAEKGLIAVQMMMLREKVEQDGAYEVLKKLAELGFHGVEISQIPMTPENVAEIKRACENFDIEVVAGSAALEGADRENLTDHFDKIVADMKTLNCNFLRIGMLPIEGMSSKEVALEFIARMEEKAKALAEHGIDLYYHNHHVEFAKYDGKYLLDIIRDNTETIGFEIDVHWVHRGGENPVTYLENFKGRLKLLHLKDYRVVPVKPVEADPSDSPQVKRQKFQQAFNSVVQFAEIGEGSLNFPAIIQAGLDAGSEYFIIEQDDRYGRDVYEALTISRDNLYKMGYKSWFTR